MSNVPDYTRVLFTDLLGLSHGKIVPTERLDEPFHTAIDRKSTRLNSSH